MNKFGIGIVSDDPVFQRAIRQAAAQHPDHDIVSMSLDSALDVLGETPSLKGLLIDGKGDISKVMACLNGLADRARDLGIPLLILKDVHSSLVPQQCLDAGCTGIIPRTTHIGKIKKALETACAFDLYIWGARGTLPVCGRKTLKYGGSTSSVSLKIAGNRQFVFDAGTGLRNFSRHLMRKEGGRFNGRIFITHPHWDHLNCIPFFEPLYLPENQIYLMGPPHEGQSFRELLEGQMNGIYFPIKPESFKAKVTYITTEEGCFLYDGIRVKALRLDHPGCCLGYRIEHAGRSIAYITDNELRDESFSGESWDALVTFLDGVDYLIHDCSYFDEEYLSRIHWGHSSVGRVVALALAARVGHLFLFHHDPEHGDTEIEAKLREAERHVSMRGGVLACHNAREGDIWNLAAGRLKGSLR